ncbi:peptidoglycan recognition protein family protein [Neptunicella sp.]|uniref:peptidoglycan recognition protein family protein n=1 Tax=Neptunicella sp. TaxID=2125986 RepID=UPI003F68DDB3
MSDIDAIITALTVAAGFSLLIERIIEFLKHVIDGANANQVKSQALQESAFMPQKANEALKKYHAVLNNLEDKTANLSPLIDLQSEQYQQKLFKDGDFAIMEERLFEKTSSIALKQLDSPTEADLNRARLQLFYLLSAFGFAVAISSLMNIHLLSMLMLKDWMTLSASLKVADHILTGLVIAGGAQPIHLLITFLTSKKVPELEQPVEYESKEQEIVASANDTPVVSTATLQMEVGDIADIWTPINYQGGVRPDSLEERNLRQGEPNLIVYHHTAMHSQLGFQAIVDEFLIAKQWSTGYHCVIMPDGAIKPFCRWDRVGNHTKAYNNRSLGIAFHGNFHLADGDKYANNDGRYGIQQPTQNQLQSGARVIALWTHLYAQIKLDFDSHILPHCDVLAGQTVCPGSNFPHVQLQKQVSHFYLAWLNHPEAMQQIERFQHKNYLYSQEAH